MIRLFCFQVKHNSLVLHLFKLQSLVQRGRWILQLDSWWLTKLHTWCCNCNVHLRVIRQPVWVNLPHSNVQSVFSKCTLWDFIAYRILQLKSPSSTGGNSRSWWLSQQQACTKWILLACSEWSTLLNEITLGLILRMTFTCSQYWLDLKPLQDSPLSNSSLQYMNERRTEWKIERYRQTS